MSRSPDEPEVLQRFNSALELVDKLARQIARTTGPGVAIEELESFGREGLLEAARRYDPDRGVPFMGYASFRVRGAMIDGVRSLSRVPRRARERLRALQAAVQVSEGAAEDVLGTPPPPGSAAADAERALDAQLAAMATAMAIGNAAPLDAPVAAEEANPEEQLAHAELLEAVRGAVGQLPDQEASLIRRHYFEGVRFDAIAEELGLSKSWTSRLHTRAVSRLARRLRGLAD